MSEVRLSVWLAILALMLWVVFLAVLVPWAWRENHPCEAHGGHIAVSGQYKGRCVK